MSEDAPIYLFLQNRWNHVHAQVHEAESIFCAIEKNPTRSSDEADKTTSTVESQGLPNPTSSHPCRRPTNPHVATLDRRFLWDQMLSFKIYRRHHATTPWARAAPLTDRSVAHAPALPPSNPPPEMRILRERLMWPARQHQRSRASHGNVQQEPNKTVSARV